MALTDDQRAMLRLLAQREQGYPDIAALTGQSVEEVRTKVSAAVEALGGAETPAEDQRAMLRLLAQREEGYADIAALTGQSVEEVRSKVAVALEELGGGPPASPPPASPASKPAAAPKPKPAAAKPAAGPASPRSRPGRPKLPADRGAVWGLGAGLAVVLILVVLLATGALGGGGDGSSSEGAGESQASGNPKSTKAVLEAVDGGDAKGLALFGRENKKVLLLVQATGLEPSPSGKSYTVSLAKASDERLPLVATSVGGNGRLEGSFQIAPQVLGLLASGWDTMEVSLVSNGELSTALKAARSAKKAPSYEGEDALRGAVTGAIVEAGEQGEVKP